MKVVIQCAASKDSKGGYFHAADGQRVKFVARPEQSPAIETCVLAHPDDPTGTDSNTWRDLVAEYNKKPNDNPFGLFPAYRLYSNPAYGALINQFGEENVFILSAGWGLIRSNFLTPQYDITFNTSADAFKRRKQRDPYLDFCHLAGPSADRIVFLGGKSYLPLFCQLTETFSAERIVFFNSQAVPSAPGCRVVRYHTTLRTNWHYACVNDLLAGKIALPGR